MKTNLKILSAMENMIITTLHLDKACRVCLQEFNEMHSLFSKIRGEDNLEESSYIYDILMNISSMKILPNDGLPAMICTTCMELAHTSFRFQQQCNRAHAILEHYLSQIHEKINDSADTNFETDNSVDFLQTASPLLEDIESESENCNDFEKIREQRIQKNNNDDEENVISEKSDTTEYSAQDDSSNKADLPKQKIVNDITNCAKVSELETNKKLRQKITIKQGIQNKHKKSLEGVEKKNGASVGNVSYYITVNDNEKMYTCNVCEKSYKHISSLKIHTRTHTLERPYVCKMCGKGFKQYGALTYHIRSHTGEQPYACKMCGKRYKQSGTLTAHMRVHTGQRPFLCSVCGRGFRQAPDLGYHMRTHTKEKPYMCNICGKTMRMQCHLVQHMRTHTGERPFKCTECDKAFPSSTRLKRHAIIHTNLKPYTCDVCKKSFNRSSTLRVHSKIHTDERPYICSVCGKGFIQAHALRSHLLTHSLSESSVEMTFKTDVAVKDESVNVKKEDTV